eukprot:6002966-Amphidinium_carterae.1
MQQSGALGGMEVRAFAQGTDLDTPDVSKLVSILARNTQSRVGSMPKCLMVWRQGKLMSSPSNVYMLGMTMQSRHTLMSACFANNFVCANHVSHPGLVHVKLGCVCWMMRRNTMHR